MTLTLNFKEGGWCKELETSFAPGVYVCSDEKEFAILAPYAGVKVEAKATASQQDAGPYAEFGQPELIAELEKRGIDWKAAKANSNVKKLALLEADDAKKKEIAEKAELCTEDCTQCDETECAKHPSQQDAGAVE